MDPTAQPSVRRQGELLEISPSTYYYVAYYDAAEESSENLALMRLIDEE